MSVSGSPIRLKPCRPDRVMVVFKTMLSTEEQLLISLSDLLNDPPREDGVRQCLDAGVNWDRLMVLGNHHRMTPMMHSLFKELDNAHIPETVLARLESIYEENKTRNLDLAGHLTTLATSLKEHSIECMILKGLYMARTVFKDIAWRPMADIDLLVRKEDMPEADALLGALGFACEAVSAPRRFYHFVHFHLSFVHQPRSKVPIVVELHWALQDRYRVLHIDTKAVWQRSQEWTLADGSIRVMNNEDLFVYLCYHVDKHSCFSRYVRDFSTIRAEEILNTESQVKLLWYLEILLLLKQTQKQLDWNVVIDRCHEWGVEAEVRCTLESVGKLFGTPLVKEPVAMLKPSPPGRLTSILYPLLLGRPGSKSGSTGSMAKRLRSVLTRDRTMTHFRAVKFLDIGAFIFPSLKTVSRRYGGTGLVLYYGYLRHMIKATTLCSIVFTLLVFYGLRAVLFKGANRSRQHKQSGSLRQTVQDGSQQ